MKRALLTVHKFFPEHKAGTEVLTLRFAQELKRRGYEVMVIAANPPDQDARLRHGPEVSQYDYEGIAVHVVEEALRLKTNTYRSEFYNPTVGEFFRGELEAFAPDVVHIFHAQNLSSSIIEESLAKKLPVIVSTTDFWFVCPIVQLKRPDGAICRGPGRFGTNCLTCYTPELFPATREFDEAVEWKYPNLVEVKKRLSPGLDAIANKALYLGYLMSKVPSAVSATMARPKALRDSLNGVSAITVPTKLMRDIFIENGIREDLIHHIPFGIDTAPFQPHQKKSSSENLRVAYVGTIFEHKGVDLLIRAFLALPSDAKAELTVYGDLNQFPEYANSLLKLADVDSPNAKKIKFAGTFPNSEFGEVLSEIDVLVVPSRWYENTPLVIQSALASMTPLIVTNLGGMAELVHHEVNGLVFELNDAASLKQQILRLLNEPLLLRKLASNIKPERTTEEMVDEIEELYFASWRRTGRQAPGVLVG
jgi:glycosyltransferase involved in cell wall biosynthesis